MTAASLDGHRLADARVYVPRAGAWWAEVVFEEAPDVSGVATLALGGLELRCTIDARYDGTQGLQRRSRVVGGAGSWGSLLPPKTYHNDLGVRARTIAEDAAREAGEELADFAPSAERVGPAYVRQAGPASRALEDVIGTAAWWVGYDGRTRIGERPTVEAEPGSYEVLDYDPAARLVTLTADDLGAVQIGSVLAERLDAPQTVAELDVHVTPDHVRIVAWTGEGTAQRGRLAGALRRIIERSTDRRLHGLYRYRVVRMSGDRAELQAVRRAGGLPDLLPISAWPGIAGAHAELTPGAEVLVQFVEGDRTQPIVSHFAGKDGTGWAPVELVLTASSRVRLGGTVEGANERVAREGDTVRVEIPAGSVVIAASGGTVNPTPLVLDGTITSGSDRVRSA